MEEYKQDGDIALVFVRLLKVDTQGAPRWYTQALAVDALPAASVALRQGTLLLDST